MKSIFDPTMVLLSGDIHGPQSGGGGTVDYQNGDTKVVNGVTYYYFDGVWYDENGNPEP